MRRGVLIANRTAGGRAPARLLLALEALLRREGFRLETVLTAAPGDASELARRAAAGGADAVFALGGDGTLREAAQGLLGTGVPLAPLPGGTANVLIRALGLPRNPIEAARSICRLEPRTLDVGLIGPPGGPARVFLMMASAGLDARVLARLSPLGKRLFGRGHVAAAGLRHWWLYDYPALRLEVDGEPVEASFAAVSNIPLYGGGFRLAPAARFDDRALDLVLFRGSGRWATLGFAASLARGAHLGRADVEARPVREVRLLGPVEDGGGRSRPDVQVDGDHWPEAPPLVMRLAPEPLPVLAPVVC